jgi:hypothetical protein
MTQVQSSNLLDVLKKKMRQTKEEMEKYKEESEDMARKLQVEIRRREEVGGSVCDLTTWERVIYVYIYLSSIPHGQPHFLSFSLVSCHELFLFPPKLLYT